jgi:riboflavin synthase/PKD repeat protein
MENLTKKFLKYCFILFLYVTSTVSFATEVPVEKAKLVATNYLRHLTNQPLKRSGDIVKLVYTPKQTSLKRAASSPLFYVFNQVEGSGFIVVSGDDNIKPILGYSLESNFDENNLSPQVAYWLSEYEKQIAFAVESNFQNTIQRQQWEMISSNQIAIKRGTTAVKPLLKTTWDQGTFYNDSCPYDNTAKKRVPVGCVATAMAQTMKYWGYPTTGVGSTSYTHATYGLLKANFGKTTYNWGAMSNKATSSNIEIARLMYHCGVSIDMNYGPDGSGAWATYESKYAKYANLHLSLIDYFKYDNTSISSIFKRDFTDQAWQDKLKIELNQGRVIVYCGNDGTGKSGHCFVFDGYDMNDFFHIDWGWSGQFNGYFTISNLVPNGTGTGGGSGNYSSNQEAVIGIRPKVSQVPVSAFSASTNFTSVGQVINLVDESTNYPHNWSWTISPNNATFVNGTTNTSKFPELSFSIPGKYTVTLTSTNSKGANTIAKTDYIIVNPALGKQVCDTMTNFLATEKKTYVRIKGGGSLAGHINGLNGFAEQYTIPSNFTHISGILLDFARAETNNTTSTIKVGIYQNDNGVPGTILSSKNVKISDIKNDVLNGVPSKVMFDSPIAVNGLFYIGFETTNVAGDSVGLYTTQTTGVTTNTAFMKISSNNSWCTYEKCWSSLKIHLSVSPLVSILPSPNFVINSTPTKTNTSVEIDASSSSNAYAYNWNLTGANKSKLSYYKESITYATPGTYDITLDAIGGCGNTASITKQIVVASTCNSGPVYTTITETKSDSFTWNGSTYTQSGTYIYQTITKGGCDSIVTLNLTINPVKKGIDVQTACTSYTWIDGKTYTTSNNNATYRLVTKNGYDSIVTLNLTINSVKTGKDVKTACASYTWIDGKTYTTSNNTATYKLVAKNGCDSIVTLNLTINTFKTGIDVQSACKSYTWIDGKNYTASNNTATYKMVGKNGCDSIVTLNLTINTFKTGKDVKTACVSYTWIDGKTYTASTNTATYTLVTKNGCDSIVTLDLTINSVKTGKDVKTACASYTWIDGKTYTASTNNATHKLVAKNGCDSIVTLDLTINPVKTGIDVKTSCGSYTWIDGKTYTASTNNATHKLVSKNGCDSIVTLNLTINPVKTGIDTKTACGSYTWIDGNTYTASTNSATQKLFSKKGCDSIVTLNLTINDKPAVSATLQNGSLAASTSNDTYQWLDCDADPIANATTQTYLPTQTGNYAVKVSLKGCEATSACVKFETQTTGLADANHVTFRIYPNPNQGVFNIAGLPIGSYKIMNLMGAEVFQFNVDKTDAQLVNLSHLAKGVYQIASEQHKLMHNKVVITD